MCSRVCVVEYGSILSTILDNREHVLYIVRCDDNYVQRQDVVIMKSL